LYSLFMTYKCNNALGDVCRIIFTETILLRVPEMSIHRCSYCVRRFHGSVVEKLSARECRQIQSPDRPPDTSLATTYTCSIEWLMSFASYPATVTVAWRNTSLRTVSLVRRTKGTERRGKNMFNTKAVGRTIYTLKRTRPR